VGVSGEGLLRGGGTLATKDLISSGLRRLLPARSEFMNCTLMPSIKKVIILEKKFPPFFQIGALGANTGSM